MVITSETPVRDIAVGIPTAIPLLERIGIDYCCHGQHTLTEACTKKNIALAPVLEELEKLQPQSADPAESRWAQAPLKELSEHIVKRHHAYTREQLDLIDGLMAKVENRHGAQHVEVFQIGKVVAVFGSELRHHAECEENNLFPYIAALGSHQKPELPAPAKGSLNMPIARMMTDHDKTAEELKTLRTLTDDFTPPAEACPTWRALYRAMEELESDLHQHIHLENNILFPRALEQARIEAQKAGSGCAA